MVGIWRKRGREQKELEDTNVTCVIGVADVRTNGYISCSGCDGSGEETVSKNHMANKGSLLHASLLGKGA